MNYVLGNFKLVCNLELTCFLSTLQKHLFIYFTFSREIQIPSKDESYPADRSPDLEIEVSSIAVLREEMIKG